MEAAILKVPVVATDVGGISEILKDGESAQLVQANDPVALANACVKVCNNYLKAQEQTKVAYTDVNEKFSINGAREKITRVYRCAFDKLSLGQQ